MRWVEAVTRYPDAFAAGRRDCLASRWGASPYAPGTPESAAYRAGWNSVPWDRTPARPGGGGQPAGMVKSSIDKGV